MSAPVPKGLTTRAVSGMLWMAWGSVANAGLKIVVLIVLARLLTPEEVGVVGAALIVIWIGQGFAQLGLAPALVQRPTLTPQHAQTAFAASVVLGVVFAAATALGAPWIAAFFRMDGFEPVLRVLALMFPLRGVSVTAEALMQRDLRFRWLANLEVATYGLGYGIGGVALASQGWGIWSLVAAQLLQTTFKSAVLLAVRPPTWRVAPTAAALRDLLSFGTGYTLTYLAFLVGNQVDNIVVGRELGRAALGVYSRAFQLTAELATRLGDVVDQVLFSSMARLQDDRERLGAAYLRGIALVSLATLPVSIVLVPIAPELIHVTLGPRWAAVVAPFQILAAGMVFRVSFRVSDSLARATGIGYGRVWRQTVFAILVLVGASVGQRWGVPGVAWGVLGALFLNFVLTAHLGLKVVGLSWSTFAGAYAPPLRCAMFAGGTAWATLFLARAAELPAFARLVMAASVTLAATGLVLWRRPAVFLGGYGLWIRDTLHAYLWRRANPLAAGGVAPGGSA